MILSFPNFWADNSSHLLTYRWLYVSYVTLSSWCSGPEVCWLGLDVVRWGPWFILLQDIDATRRDISCRKSLTDSGKLFMLYYCNFIHPSPSVVEWSRCLTLASTWNGQPPHHQSLLLLCHFSKLCMAGDSLVTEWLRKLLNRAAILINDKLCIYIKYVGSYYCYGQYFTLHSEYCVWLFPPAVCRIERIY